MVPILSLNLKLALVGDYAVGKTSLVQRYVNRIFLEEYKPTLGFDVLVKYLSEKGHPLTLSIWDIGAGMGFKHLRGQYLYESRGCLIVCDLTRKETLDNVEQWANEVKAMSPSAPIILVGNKADATTLQVAADDITQKAGQIGAIGGLVVSAKYGSKVDDAFEMLLRKILHLHELAPKQ